MPFLGPEQTFTPRSWPVFGGGSERIYSVVREVGTGCGTRERLVRASN